MLQALRSSAPLRMVLQSRDARVSATLAAFAGDVDAGGLIFRANYAACPLRGNSALTNEETLGKEARVTHEAGGFSEESVAYQVANGKNAMPAFGGRQSVDEIGDVVSFVFDQALGTNGIEFIFLFPVLVSIARYVIVAF